MDSSETSFLGGVMLLDSAILLHACQRGSRNKTTKILADEKSLCRRLPVHSVDTDYDRLATYLDEDARS